MLDGDGHVGECTGDNIFIVKGGGLATPVQGCLLGITRQAILDIASKAIRLR
jgi:branched-chain amino acid aminotransferase